MQNNPPSGGNLSASRTLLDPPERDPQRPALHPRGATPGPNLENSEDYPPGVAIQIAAVQSQLDDTDKRVRDPPTLSINFRHSGWAHNRLLVYRALQRTDQSFSRREGFAYCGSSAYVLQSVDNPTVYKLAGSSCHDRFCLPCASDRGRGIAGNVLEYTAGRTIRFLTLTLKSSHDALDAQLDRLYAAFARLRRRALWLEHVTGGIAFLELTYNSSASTWHPHFHALIEGKYLPQPLLKKLWLEITTDSYVVDIRAVRDHAEAARYVTKYASKPFNNTFLNRPDPLDEAIRGLKGRKTILSFGLWRGLTVVTPPSPDGWIHIAPLEDVLTKAASGDTEALHILAVLTDADLGPILARAPPVPAYTAPPPKPMRQCTFFGSWANDNCYL